MRAGYFAPQCGAKACSLDLIKQLKTMRDMGAVTQEEYEEKKRELLGRL